MTSKKDSTASVEVTSNEGIQLGQSERDVEHLLVERYSVLGDLKSVGHLMDDVGGGCGREEEGQSANAETGAADERTNRKLEEGQSFR